MSQKVEKRFSWLFLNFCFPESALFEVYKREILNVTDIAIRGSIEKCERLKQIENSKCLTTLETQLLEQCGLSSIQFDDLQSIVTEAEKCKTDPESTFFENVEQTYCQNVDNPVECTKKVILECSGTKIVNNELQFIPMDEVDSCIAQAKAIET